MNNTKFAGNTTEWANGDWFVKWICYKQWYEVYYKGALFAIKYKFSDIRNYID